MCVQSRLLYRALTSNLPSTTAKQLGEVAAVACIAARGATYIESLSHRLAITLGTSEQHACARARSPLSLPLSLLSLWDLRSLSLSLSSLCLSLSESHTLSLSRPPPLPLSPSVFSLPLSVSSLFRDLRAAATQQLSTMSCSSLSISSLSLPWVVSTRRLSC